MFVIKQFLSIHVVLVCSIVCTSYNVPDCLLAFKMVDMLKMNWELHLWTSFRRKLGRRINNENYFISQKMKYLSAARTGTVLFSTMILCVVATFEICRAADSIYFKSGALPLISKNTEFRLLKILPLYFYIKLDFSRVEGSRRILE